MTSLHETQDAPFAFGGRTSLEGAAAPPRRIMRLLLLLYICSMFVTSFFVNQGSHGIAAIQAGVVNIGSEIFIVFLGGVALFCILNTRRFHISPKSISLLFGRPVFLVLSLLYVLQFLSSFYASSRVAALYESLPATVTLLVALAAHGDLARGASAQRYRLSDLWHYAMVVQSWILLLLLISGITSPDGFSHEAGVIPVRLRGGWFSVHPDLSGVMAEVGLAHFLLIRRKKRPADWACVVCNLAVLVLAQSRTAYSMAGVAVLVWYLLRGRASLWLNLSAICLVPLVGVGSGFLERLFVRGQTAEGFAGLTGRVALWRAAFDYGMKRPIFGYGAFSGIRENFAATFQEIFPNLEIRTLDNQYMNTFIETGGLGVFLLVTFLVLCATGTISKFQRQREPHNLEMLILALVFPLRAWFGQLLVFYDPTQLYALFVVLTICLRSPTWEGSPVGYRPTARRPLAGARAEAPAES